MSDATHTGVRRLALVRVGRFQLAIDGALVESVVRGPLPLSPFPCVAPHVLGAFTARTGPIPAVDLVALLDGRTAATPRDTIDLAVVLRMGAGRVALVIDAVGSVVPVGAGTLAGIERYSAEGAGLFTELFAPASGEAPAIVLDVAAVLRIADLHTAVQSDRDDGAHAADDVEAQSLVFVRAGEALFAIDAAAVAHVERRTASDDFVLRHPTLRGFHLRAGRHLPVVDLLASLELPPSTRSDAGSHIVILDDRRGAASTLIVDAVVAVVRVSPDAVHPLSDEALASGPLVRGSVHDARHGIVVVLDTDALIRATAVGTNGEADAAGGAAGERAVGSHYMVYQAGGGLLASQLADVAAVAQLPSDFVDLRRDGSPMVGIFSRFGRVIPVLDLGALTGAPPLREVVAQPVLIVETPTGAQGFLLESVAFLRSATASRIPSPGRRQVGVLPRLTEMITITSDGADRSATVLDLRALAERTTTLADFASAGVAA